MIQSFYPNYMECGLDGCRTTGCSCCSVDLNIKSRKKKILEEARENIRVVKQICEFYKLPFNKFCSDILTSSKCKKHKFWDKFEDTKVCWYCDEYKKTIEKKEGK